MNDMNFQYHFTSSKKPSEVFEHLIHPENWWRGLFGETIEGKSNKINDEFSFLAGEGMHYSVQRLIEKQADKKITWLVSESNLSFLENPGEWTGTKISFDIEQENDETKVTFTHEGLIPPIECYANCSNAWGQYLRNLEEKLK